jgi:gas vesicle protein
MTAKLRKIQEPGFPYLVVGIGIGLLAGFLWAPRPGKEMREGLRRGADDGLDYLNKETEKIRAGAEHWSAKIRERFGGRKPSDREDSAG